MDPYYRERVEIRLFSALQVLGMPRLRRPQRTVCARHVPANREPIVGAILLTA